MYNTARPLSAKATKSGYLQLLALQIPNGQDATLGIPDALITSEGSEIYYFENGQVQSCCCYIYSSIEFLLLFLS